MNLLGDLSSQVVSAEAAAASARSIAESFLKKARVITPHHRLLLHDHVLLSSPALDEAQGQSELLEDKALQDAARLVRDSLAVFPMKVACLFAHGRRCVPLIYWTQEAAYHLARCERCSACRLVARL
jgi:hypothetical protein